MTAERPPLAHRTDGTGHWLMFTAGQIVGCFCGFDADLDSDCGWGDSVLDHIEEVVRAEEREGALTEAAKRIEDVIQSWQPHDMAVGARYALRIVTKLRDKETQ